MATGKQLAFQSGEISPAMRFNSREVSYATGLSKLKNGYIRGEGGVSNRQGFKQAINPLTGNASSGNWLPQPESIQPSVTGIDPLKPSITMMSFWDNESQRWRVIEFCEKTHPDASLIPLFEGKVLHYRLDFRGDFQPVYPEYEGQALDDFVGLITLPKGLNSLKSVVVDSYILFLPFAVWQEWKLSGSDYTLDKYSSINICYSLKRERFEVFGLEGYGGRPYYSSAGSSIKGLITNPPYFPARYLITLEDEEGFEFPVMVSPTSISDITTWDPAGAPGTEMLYASSNVSASWKSRIKANPSVGYNRNVEKYIARLYRVSWTSGSFETMNFSLVATGSLQQVGADPTDFEVQFQDFGASDVTTKPPIVSYMVNIPFAGTSGVSFDSRWDILGNAVTACFFQQRLHVYVEEVTGIPQQESPLGLGTISYPCQVPQRGKNEFLVSRLNAPKLLNQPVVYSRPSDPFIYKVQGMRGEKPLFSLSLERPIHFTSRGVYGMMGDQSGSITATSVNPECISDVGCYANVEPKVVGDSAYFISQDGRRLHRLQWTGSQTGYKVEEVSKYSSHLIEDEEIIRIEGTSNSEEVVYLLTQSGKLIHVTINEDSYGWGTTEIEGGRIENICTIKVKPNYEEDFLNYADKGRFIDVLSAYVIRNGIRTLEYLDDRYDYGHWGNQVFLDSAAFMGSYLTRHTGFHWKIGLPMNGFYRQPWMTDFEIYGDDLPYWSSANRPTEQGFLTPQGDDAITPNLKLNIGDGSTTSWEVGDTVSIFTSGALNPGGPVAGIDYNSVDEFRLVVSYTREWYDDNRKKKRVFIKCHLKVDLSTEVSDTSISGFNRRYTAEIEENSIPEEIQNVAGKSITTAEKNLLWTRWQYAYRNFVVKETAELIHPLQVLYNSAPEKFRTPEGVQVGVTAEGRILRNPLDPNCDERAEASLLIKESYSDGQRFRITLDDYTTGVWIGFPYEFEMQTLPIESSDNRTLYTGRTLVTEVGLGLHNTQGGYIGMPDTTVDKMEPMENNKYGAPYFLSQTPNSYSGYIAYSIPSEWNDGTVTIKHIDPTALTVAAIFPRGENSAR